MTPSVMRLSESITIYLAAGASFGVSRYLCALGLNRNRARAAAEGLTAALLWPFVAAAILIKQVRHIREGDGREEADARVRERVEDAKRMFIISINNVLECVRTSRTTGRTSLEQTLYALRESAEQYVGLCLIEADADEDAVPAAREAELARISGRRGHDLRVAARCVHRRNVSRIKAHHRRERARLLRKLAELGAGAGTPPLPEQDEMDWRRKMTQARLELYLRAADLFSLLEDERAAQDTAQLIDAECSILRRLRETDEAAPRSAYGEERCTGHSPQLI